MNRKIVNALLLLFVLFILYNTLIPFQFEFNGNSLEKVFESIEWRFFIYEGRRAPLTDLVGNIFLFIPLGFLLFWWRYQRNLRPSIIDASIIGLLLSILIEILQLFVKGRVSSVTDIFNNTLGTFLGAFAAYVYFRLFAKSARDRLRKLAEEQPATLLLVAIFGLQAVGAIFPFHVSISITDLKNSLKQINVMPFQNISLSFLLLNRPVRLDSSAFNWFGFAENMLFWSVWGYLTALCRDSYWRIRRDGKWIALAVGLIPGVLMEFLQIFIISRHCDINDIISNWAGVVLGMLTFAAWRRFRRFSDSDVWHDLTVAVWFYAVFIIFAGLQPFDFKLPADGLVPNVGYTRLIPFLAYYQNTSIWNIYDLTASLLYFFPVGLFISHVLYQRRFRWHIIYIYTGMVGFFT
ncbi:MAG: VanZ family protein, partial [Proteobacteria bacterium]|nr:VanZ family protein [Pseudomonadota bacterium]